MSDISISPAAPFDAKVASRPTPSYLVSIERGKNTEYFIATKFDDLAYGAKVVGFYVSENIDKIISEYDNLIKTTEKLSYMEVVIPWGRILSIRSLLFRQR